MRLLFDTSYRASWLVGSIALSCANGSPSSFYAGAEHDGGGATRSGVAAPDAGQSNTTSTTSGGARGFGEDSGGISAGAAGADGGAPSDSEAGGGAVSQGGAGATSLSGAHAGPGAGQGNTLGGSTTSELRRCAEACQSDFDCRIGSSDFGYACNPSTQRCEKPGSPCRSHAECLPAASSWLLSCSASSDCFYFADDVCVSVAGSGKCARLAPNGAGGVSGCQPPFSDAVLLPELATGRAVLVCANARQHCQQGECVPICKADTDCTPARNGSLCDIASGSCRCVRDGDCGGPGVSWCNATTGSCECSRDTDCDDVPGSDICVAGRCGCSSVAQCSAQALFDGTSSVCE